MSFLTTIEGWWAVTEQDVWATVVKIKQDIDVAESDIIAALNWIADNAPAIAADIQRVLSIVQVVGISSPAVETAVVAANEAVSALNAFATASKSGANTVDSVVAGYSALNSAQAAVASATAHAVSA